MQCLFGGKAKTVFEITKQKRGQERRGDGDPA